MKAICSNNFFVVSRQKACIKNITEPDLPENKSSGKRDATIVSCSFRTAPKSANLFSLHLQKIRILASGVSRLVYCLRRTLTFNACPSIWGLTPAPSGWGFTFHGINQ